MTESNTGRVFRTTKGAYRELKYLGGGQTAEVYRVRRENIGDDWALKLLTAPELAQRFFQEVDTLGELNLAPQRALLQEDGRSLVPQVIDEQQTGNERFFVMSLAIGTPLDEVLRDKGSLSEREALHIMARVTRVFRVLHEDLQRSYLDFQPRDIFWQPENGRIMVIDWNLLSRRGQADVAGDILALGKLLYRMTVGVERPPHALTLAPGWGRVTVGAQEILRRSTHRNPARRYPTMQALQAQIEAQLALWDTDPATLIVQAGEAVTKAQQAQTGGPRGADQPLWLAAKRVTDIASQKADALQPMQAGMLNQFKSMIATGLQSTRGSLATALILFGAKDAEKAVEQFQVAFNETDDIREQLTAARWRLVAEAASAGKLSDQHREVVLEAREQLEAAKYLEAERLLSDSVVAACGRPIALLRDEARAWQRRARAEELQAQVTDQDEGSYRRAADACRAVVDLIEPLPQKEPLLEEWGDLAGVAEKLTRRAELLAGRKGVIDGVRRSLREDPPEKSLSEVRQRLGENPGDPILIDMSLSQAREWLGNLKVASARSLLQIALDNAGDQPRDALAAEWRVADSWLKGQAALGATPRNLAEFERAIQVIDSQKLSTAREPALSNLLRQAMDRADKLLDPALASVAARLALAVGQPSLSLRDQAVQDKAARRSLDDRLALDQQIDGYLSEYRKNKRPELLTSAAALLNWRMAHADPGSEDYRALQAGLDEVTKLQKADQAEGNIRPELEALKEPTTAWVEPEHAADLEAAAAKARALTERASAAGLYALANQCSQTAEGFQSRRNELQDVAARLSEVDELRRIADTMKGRRDLRDQRIATLKRGTAILEEAKKSGLAPRAIATAETALTGALAELGADRDPADRPPSPTLGHKLDTVTAGVTAVQADLADLRGRLAEAPAAETKQTKGPPKWLFWVPPLVAAFLAIGALAGLAYFLRGQVRQDTQEQVAAAFATLDAREAQAAKTATAAVVQATRNASASATASAASSATAVAQATADARAAAAATEQARQAVVATQTAQVLATQTTVAAQATQTAVAMEQDLKQQLQQANVRLAFPAQDVTLPVMPWQVQVDASQWLTGTYRLLLDGQEIASQPRDAKSSGPWVYQRAVSGFFDDFPNLKSEARLALKLDGANPLPAGTHTLALAFLPSLPDAPELPVNQVSVTISPTLGISATVQGAAGNGQPRLATPGGYAATGGSGIIDGDQVMILGKVTITPERGKETTWYLWEAPAVSGNQNKPLRRGWQNATYFQLPAGKTEADVPLIAP